MNCRHDHKAFRKVTFFDGRGFHIIERCLDCGENARGNVWVPREDVANLEALLEDDVTPADPRQQRLF